MYSSGLGSCGGSATARMESMCRVYEVAENDEVFSGFEQKKRRLNMEQVKYLEMSFEMERKLDPERKMQLASELGLKPRQIAVWYQNRRARWKAKQMEKDYDILRQKYSCVLLEKQKLESEVMELRKELQASKGPDADQSKQFEHLDLEDSLVIIEEGLEEYNCTKNSTSCCSDAASEFNVEEEDQKSNKSRILQDNMAKESKEIDEAEVEVSEEFYDYLTVLDEHHGMGIGSVYNIF